MDATRPSNPVLIYDGDCGFCYKSAQRIRSLSGDLEITSWQETDLDAYSLTPEMASTRVYYWSAKKSKIYGGAPAIARAMIESNKQLVRIPGRVISIPPFSWLAAAMYPYVAKYRHKLPGGTPACEFKPKADD